MPERIIRWIPWKLNAALGEKILDAFPDMSVDVHNPDVMLYVEIREQINIYSEEIPGPGGMPVGTDGKAMLLLSGGIDSPVAGYMICQSVVLPLMRLISMHRHIHSPSVQSRRSLIWQRQVPAYTGPIDLHVVNFTDIQLYYL